jgi:hypothetical protein
VLDADRGQKVATEIGFYALPTDTLNAMRTKLIQ